MLVAWGIFRAGRLSTLIRKVLWWATWANPYVSVWALQKKIASPGKGILAMDESNATCGKRLDSIGLENTEANRLAYRELLVTTPGIGNYISGAILFEETLYQKISTGKTIVEALNAGGMVPGMTLPLPFLPLAILSSTCISNTL
jgi:fructose-bisphosphate aldolase class 1